MKELLEKLEGNKYYVDVWATWCGPCIEEFKHNKDLNAVLKSKGYKNFTSPLINLRLKRNGDETLNTMT